MRPIDADALILKYRKLVDDEWNRKTSPVSWAGALESVIEDIEDAPKIDAAPVVYGRWKSGPVLEKCSVCGKKGFPEWRYCPNCGARMEAWR